MPALDANLDRDPEPLGQVEDGSLGTLAVTSAKDAEKYGVLGARYQALRSLYKCVAAQLNEHKAPAECLK